MTSVFFETGKNQGAEEKSYRWNIQIPLEDALLFVQNHNKIPHLRHFCTHNIPMRIWRAKSISPSIFETILIIFCVLSSR